MSDNSSPPLANSPEARTATGEILNQSPTPTPTSTPASTSDPSTHEPAAASAPAADAQPAVPDSYTFAPPAKGVEVDPELVASATPIFRELGLNQAQADKLIGLYNKHATIEGDKTKALIAAQGAKWSEEVKADPELGPNLEKIKTTIGRAFDAINDPKTVAAFKDAMDFTMAGSNPAFIRMFHKMAERIVEGQHVSGTGPVATNGRGDLTTSQRPSLAASMYPNLKAS